MAFKVYKMKDSSESALALHYVSETTVSYQLPQTEDESFTTSDLHNILPMDRR
jgi:hypothetical protein